MGGLNATNIILKADRGNTIVIVNTIDLIMNPSYLIFYLHILIKPSQKIPIIFLVGPLLMVASGEAPHPNSYLPV